MNKIVSTASAVALLALSSLPAFAAQASGKIASVDATAKTVTLDNGQMFDLSSSVDAASLKPGEQVTITYEQSSNGKLTASNITAGAM